MVTATVTALPPRVVKERAARLANRAETAAAAADVAGAITMAAGTTTASLTARKANSNCARPKESLQPLT